MKEIRMMLQKENDQQVSYFKNDTFREIKREIRTSIDGVSMYFKCTSSVIKLHLVKKK